MTNCCITPSSGGWDWIPVEQSMQTDCAGNLNGQPTCIAQWEINGGALAEDNQLHSAVLMQLFTNKRVPNDQTEYISDRINRGGWWGDAFAPFEMGSLLWTLDRGAMNDATIGDAKRFAREALQPIIDQGAAASMSIEVQRDKVGGMISLLIKLFGSDGQSIYDHQYRRFWTA